ncbi:uncharacterized protein LOC114957912 isoform X1 [Acropora millepora]|uniref:uncharacterized protein LOC114957912 isoform X1 n=1 Tax=Acropora millepora TaxID=45264 RepID=UPI001CF52BC2|nr:uncharacterized protein LOC114957912 isoform X1 [Acropora millepora]
MSFTLGYANCFATMMGDSASLHVVFVINLAVLAYEVNAEKSCKPDQIVWKSDTRFKCLDCPDCPAGSQPSVPCGSSVEYRTPVHCVKCALGTYSNIYGNIQCNPCTVCSEGRGIKNNCSLFANTECNDNCIDGYYHEAALTSDCFRCTECCGDEDDEKAMDCAGGKKKCKIRSTGKPCKRKESSTGATTTTSTTTTMTTTTTTRSDNKLSSTASQPIKQESTTTIPPTTQEDGDRQLPEAQIADRYTEKGNEKLLNLVYLLIGFAALILVVMSAIIYVIRRRRQIDRPAKSDDENEESISLHEMEANSAKLTLEELQEKHFPKFENMCLKLDNGKRDYEALAAKYDEISVDERESLHDERQRKGGSPSRELMSYIKAKYPDHPVVELIKNLKDIGRKDIALILKPLVKNQA